MYAGIIVDNVQNFKKLKSLVDFGKQSTKKRKGTPLTFWQSMLHYPWPCLSVVHTPTFMSFVESIVTYVRNTSAENDYPKKAIALDHNRDKYISNPRSLWPRCVTTSHCFLNNVCTSTEGVVPQNRRRFIISVNVLGA